MDLALERPGGFGVLTDTSVLPWLSSRVPPMLAPRRMKNVASVTMKLGSLLLTTT